MGRKSKVRTWFLRVGVSAIILGAVGSVAGNPVTALGAMNSGEVSTLHTALFIATVWIISS
ncbi:MAG: hypothetical protein E5X98_20105, partial [Mesorhizobium sp.]